MSKDGDLDLFHRARAQASEDLEKLRLQGQMKKGATWFETIAFSCHELAIWFHFPHPEEYAQLGHLYMCELFKIYEKPNDIPLAHDQAWVESPTCWWGISQGLILVLKIDGKKNKIDCESLCLLAKPFLDKMLYYIVAPFLFYIMTETDNTGCHLIGCFPKEKNSFLN